MRLRTHDLTLRDGSLSLRPMTEADWDLLAPWYLDPEVMFYAEEDDVESRPIQEVQAIFRHVSQTALVFVICVDGVAIGDAWLQDMNLKRITSQLPGDTLMRIDLTIGRKDLWGQGLGTRCIALLTDLGFRQGAEAVFGCDIAHTNPRSRRAFETCGYRLWATNPNTIDLIVRPEASTA